MYIGSLSQATGASPKAIRLYESMGLLYGVQRRGAYRIYSEQHVMQVQLIRRAQLLGFKLAELQPVLTCRDGEPDWDEVVGFLKQKQRALRQEIERLEQLDVHIGLVLEELAQCLSTPPVNPSQDCDLLAV